MQDNLELVETAIAKLGTSGGRKDGALDLTVLGHLAEDIAELASKGKKFVIVTSGSRAMGEELGVKDPRTAAGVGMPILMTEYRNAFGPYGIRVEQILLESRHFKQWIPFVKGREMKNVKRAIETAWSEGIIPIINENDPVATERTTLKDNDILSRRLAKAIDAQMVIFLSTMESGNGRGGANSKWREIKKLLRRGVMVRLEDAKKEHVITKVFDGDQAGVKNIESLRQAVRESSKLRTKRHA